LIEPYFTKEQIIREDYKIDIDIFYKDIQYSYKRGTKSYGNIQTYAKEYIRKIKRMYLEIRDPKLEHMSVPEMVLLMGILEKATFLSDREERLKEELHNTLIARRLLDEAIGFVGGESFEKIRRRIDNKRTKEKNKRTTGIRI